MTIINMDAFKVQKERKALALQRAKAYNVSIKEVLTEMDAIDATTTTVTRKITVEEAMEALRGTVITPELLGISTPDLSADNTDVQIIEWDNNIPW